MIIASTGELVFKELCERFLRAPASYTMDDAGSVTATFVPPLTAQEQATFANIVAYAKSRVVGITPAEWQAIQSDIDGLVTYQGLASPTLAQTVLAVKAQSRILRAILKN